jgi:hypothetical protein
MIGKKGLSCSKGKYIPLFLLQFNYVIGKKGLSCSQVKYIPFFLLHFNCVIGKKGLSFSKGKYPALSPPIHLYDR